MKRVVYLSVAIAVLIGLVFGASMMLHGLKIDVLSPSGEVAQTQKSILMFALLLSALVVVPVFTMLVFFAVKYRAGNTKADYQPDWAENKWLESLWWGIPIFIIGILGVVTYQTSQSLDPYKPLSGENKIEVRVVALQWKWLFIYPELGIATLNQLPIPINSPVHFELTADAPMSAFWIPALGSQIYAMNGHASQLNLKATKVGEYTGYTTNINGEGYAKMTFKTKVLTKAKFDVWTKTAQNASSTMDMALYKKLALPKSETDERTYQVNDTNLFAMIMNNESGHMLHEQQGAY